MNKAYIEKLADFLDTVSEDKFEMSTYIIYPEDRQNELDDNSRLKVALSCGTGGCIAGWTVLLFRDEAKKLLREDKRIDVSNAAADILGLDDEDAFNLFHGEWADKPLVKITSKECAIHLRSLLNE